MVQRNKILEKKQKALIKKHHATRISFGCKTPLGCKIVTITGRSNNLYYKHLFPDFKSKSKLDKWLRNKCIIDAASGLNSFINESFISNLTKKRKCIDAVGTDVTKPRKTRKKYKARARFVKGDIKNLSLSALKLDKKCKKAKKIVLINNYFYLWLENPKQLEKAYRNMLTWLTPGSQIRIFPVYFGRYDAFSDRLKRFLHSKFRIKKIKPKIIYDNLYEWHPRYKRKVYIKKQNNASEKNMNHILKAKTIILTVK